MTASTPTAGARDPDAAALSALGQIAAGMLGKAGGDLSWATMKRGIREGLARDPLDTLAVTVLGGSYLFYLAEKGQNPKVESFWDALTFITTCLSVGYDDVFARTPAGKALASFVMTFGPAISGAALDPPASEKAEPTVTVSPESLEVQKQILERLEAILEALKQSGVAAPSPPASP
jgi:voltage-gated potassium channel